MKKKLISGIMNILKPSEYSLNKDLIKKHSVDWRGEYEGKRGEEYERRK